MSRTLYTSVSLHFFSFSFILFVFHCIFEKQHEKENTSPSALQTEAFCAFHSKFFPSTLPLTDFLLLHAFSLLTDGKETAIHYSHLTLSFIMEADAFQEASRSHDK